MLPQLLECKIVLVAFQQNFPLVGPEQLHRLPHQVVQLLPGRRRAGAGPRRDETQPELDGGLFRPGLILAAVAALGVLAPPAVDEAVVGDLVEPDENGRISLFEIVGPAGVGLGERRGENVVRIDARPQRRVEPALDDAPEARPVLLELRGQLGRVGRHGGPLGCDA